MKKITVFLVPIVCILVSQFAFATENPASSGHNDFNKAVVNAAPVLSDIALTLSVNEDAGAPSGAVGSLISSFTGGITDVDSGALKGIAVTVINELSGTWYYTINSGSTWSLVGSVGSAQSLLLADNAATRLYFSPILNYNGTVASGLTLRAWDQTSGTSGSKVSTASTGGATAFSSATDIIGVTVVAVNDAPVLSDLTLTVTNAEDAGVPSGAVGSLVSSYVAGMTDLDSGTLKGIAIIGANQTNGVWYFSTDSGASWNLIGTRSTASSLRLTNDSANRLYFTPNGNFNGAITSALTFRAWDQSIGANSTLGDTTTNGGSSAYSSATDTIDVTITAVNDAPILSDTALSMAAIEDAGTPSGAVGTLVNTFTGGITDIDSGAVKGIAIIGTNTSNGAWYFSVNNGSTWFPVGAVADSSALLLSNDSNTRLYFLPTANFNGTVTAAVTFRAWDMSVYAATNRADSRVNGGTTSFSSATDVIDLTVTPVNDAPLITGSPTISYTENAAAMIINSGFTAVDVDTVNLSSATISITGNFASGQDVLAFANQNGISGSYNPSTGVLSLTGAATVANYQIAISSITYANTNESPNTTARTVSFIVNDGTANSNTVTATINVTAVSETPFITGAYCPGTTTINGSSTDANGTIINVYKAGSTLLGSTAVAAGTWSLTVPALSSGDILTAKATASGQSQSTASPGVTVNATVKAPTVTAGGPITFCSGNSVTLTASLPAMTDLSFLSIATATTGIDQWQSFIPTVFGVTTGISFVPNGSAVNSGTVSIYAGEGVSGILLHSQSYSVTNIGIFTVSLPNLVLTPGQIYTARIQGSNIGLVANYNGHGVYYSSDYGYANWRLDFTTTVVPTTGSLQWYNTGSSIGGATATAYTATASGAYTCVNTVSGCSSVNSNSTSVTVNTLPATPTISAGGATTFCSGSNVVLTSSAGSSYLWSTGATTQSITVSTTGSYTVKVTNASGCFSASSGVTAVTVNSKPTLTSVGIASTNTYSSALAIIGDTVTLSFTASEIINAPTVTIAGRSAVVQNTSGNNWTASIVMTGTDPSGVISFNIAYSNAFCNNANTATTNSSSVTFDKINPSFNPVSIVSNNSTSASRAKTANIVTLSFSVSEAINALTVTIAGHTVIPNNTSGNNWTAATNMLVTDTEGIVPFSITVRDVAGNTNSATNTTNGSSVTFDKTNPLFSSVSISSNNAVASLAKIGNVVTLSFVTSETTISPTVGIAGQNVTATNTSGNNWSASYTMQSTNAEGVIPITVSIKDLAGNTASTTSTTNGSSVTFDKTAAQFSYAAMVSSNANPAYAKIGDTVTLTIGSNETIVNPTATIAGHSVTLTSIGVNQWTAAYVMNAFDTEDIIPFSISGSDLAGNPGTRNTVTTGGQVVFDKTAPTPGAVYFYSSNADPEICLAGSDSVTLDFYTFEALQSVVASIAGYAVNPLALGNNHWLIISYPDASYPEGVLNFEMVLTDLAGNTSIITTTTNGSSVTNYRQHYITVDPTTHGTITPGDGYLTFLTGQSQTYTFTPDAGYHISDVLIDGVSNSSAVSAGTYTFNNISGSHSISVTFVPSCLAADQPVVSASSLTNCGSKNTTLSIASGILNDSANWTWYANSCGGTPIGIGTSIQVAPSISTTYYVRGEDGCVLIGSCGTIAITVNPVPTAPAIALTSGSSAAICEGSSTAMEVIAGNGLSYTWSNGVSSTVISTTTPGTYTATAGNSYGCQSLPSNAITVTVNPMPAVPTVTASGPTELCPGESATLTSSLADSYQWSTGETTQSIVVGITGTYLVEARTAAGCGTASLPVFVHARQTLASGALRPFVVNGYAFSNGPGCYYLTYQSNQAASAWYPEQVDLNYDFDLKFTKYQCGPADGMTFVLQNSGTNAIGGIGSDLGYYGYSYPTDFSQSVGVEFDMYNSGSNYYDPAGEHISIVRGGDPAPAGTPYLTPVSTCTTVPVRFTWNHTSQVFSVYYNNVLVKSYQRDFINTLFGGNPKVYFGFTGGTGAEGATQYFCVDSLNFKQDLELQAAVTCNSTIISSNALDVDHYLWSSGETTPTIAVTQPGTYTLTVSTNNGCSASATIAATVSGNPIISYSGMPATFPVGELFFVQPSPSIAPAYYYTVTPELPSGLYMNAVSGDINGYTQAATPLTTYTITGYNNCGSSQTTISFAVECTNATSPSAAIEITSGSAQLCQGGNAVLSVTPIDGYSYLWSTGSTLDSITVATAGDYTVQVTNDHGCKTLSQPTTVTVITAPAIAYTGVAGNYPTGSAMTILNPQNAGGSPATIVQTDVLDTAVYSICMTMDNNGNLYYPDLPNHKVKKLATTGVITDYSAPDDFQVPAGVTTDMAGNLYVSDNQTGEIKKIATNGTVSTIHSGLGAIAAITRDSAGNFYYSNFSSGTINKVEADGTITALATGMLSYSMFLDGSGNLIFSDVNSNAVKKIAPDGTISTLATGFNFPIGIVPDAQGNIYVSDAQNNAIKKMAPNGTVSTVVSGLNFPAPLALDASGHFYTISISERKLLKLTMNPAYSIAPALPDGIVFNPENGTLSGTPTSVTPMTTYTVSTQNTCGSSTTTLSFATENACPVITAQPVNTVICSTVGATATVSVTASAATATYSWQYRVITKANPNPTWITITTANAAVYANYNTAILTITRTAALPAAGTQYRVLVGGAPGCTTLNSDTAALTILSTTKAGTIVPQATSVCLGGSLTFTASGFAGTALQWQSSPFSSTAAPGVFIDIPGATGSTYTLINAQLTSNRSYRVVVSNSCNGITAVSATKTITVNPPSAAGTVSGGGVVCRGGSGTVKVVGYTGKVQWEYSVDGTNYANAPKTADGQSLPFATTSTNSTAASYVLSAINSDCYLRAKITNGACSSAYTNVVAYTISSSATVGTVTPDNALLCSGTGTTLTLSGASGTITWQKSTNWASASPTWAATTNHTISYATGNLTASIAYRAAVTIGSCSTVYSNLAIVTIVAKPVAKPIVKNTTSPTGTTSAAALCTTDRSKFLTIGTGYVGTIQWQASTTSTTTGFVDIAGANAESYNITNPAVGANYYRVKLSNSCGVEVVSAAATVYYKYCDNSGADGLKMAAPFAVMAYPNPYTENFGLSLTTSSVEIISISIYDMTGKLLDKRALRPSDVPEVQVGEGYPSGVYTVVVTQGSASKTLRMIKR